MSTVSVGALVKIDEKTVGTIRCIYPVHEGSTNLLAEVRVHRQTELCNVKNLEVIDRASLRWRTQSN
jgi:hypothetical protein